MARIAFFIALSAAAALLGGCDVLGGALGIELPEKAAAARDADGRAIGGACRHAARAIEDCYALNRKAEKAAVFAGWRDMNDYMRENKIESVTPQIAMQGVNNIKLADDAATSTPDKRPARSVEVRGGKGHDS